MKISSDGNSNSLSDVDDESISSEHSEHDLSGMSDAGRFDGCSVSTQTVMNMSSVGTQTPWSVYVNTDSNISCISEENKYGMSIGTDASLILCYSDPANTFSFENDPTYVCDDELYEFLNKTGQ
jgi:hypothetical protein